MGGVRSTSADAADPKAPAAKSPAPAVRKPAPPSSTRPRRSSSRKATLASARAAAMAREMADTVVPRYKVDASGDLVPDLRAAAAIVYNPDTNEVLWEQNSQSQRSIASITKVMTATVFLENNPDLTAAGDDRSLRRLPGLDDAPARERQGDDRRPAAPAADRVRQRRRPGAGAGLAVGV